MPTFRVKLSTNDLNCVDVPLNPTHSLNNYAIVLLVITNYKQLQASYLIIFICRWILFCVMVNVIEEVVSVILTVGQAV